MTTRPLTQQAAKIVVTPIYHESQGRITKRTWYANLCDKAADSDVPANLIGCQHDHGHKTTGAAIECGKKMWRALP